MSRLQQIKNDYLKSLGYRNYDHLVADIKSGRSPIEKLILIEDDISEKYAKECMENSLKLASENATVFEVDWDTNIVDKESITKESNIVLL